MTHLEEFTLNEYLDGVLNERQRQETEAHLAACTQCRAALLELQQLFSALAEVEELPLTTDLSARVLAEMKPAVESVSWLRSLLGVQLVTAVVLLGILWPSIQDWLGKMGTAVSATFSTLLHSQIPFAEWLAEWDIIFLSELKLPGFPVELAAAQWGMLITLAFAAWLAGSRLLFANDFSSNEQ